MEIFNTELWVIGLALDMVIVKRAPLLKHEVMIVAVFSDSQAAIQRMALLEAGLGQQLG